ncbi:MAG: hypothetical protein JSU04_03710 [Bdellovibrionales bacterium]|nr:hypothetical protein [Bdellovibrionales bacterium]
MASVSETTGTGHSPKKERSVAGILYLALFFAVAAAVVVYFMASSHEKLNPYESNRPGATAPDVGSQVPGDRSGAVAAPQSNEVPAPQAKPAEPQQQPNQ